MSDFSSYQHADQFGGGIVIDSATIQALQELGGDDDPGLVLELIEMFLDDASTRMGAMNAAMDQGDLDTVSKAAHALKSASANIGALTFSACCKQVEATANSQDTTVGGHVDQCKGMFQEVQAALNSLRSDS